MSCCRSPRFTLTSKGPLNYMTEPLRTFHFILSCSHALYALFLQMVSNFPKGPIFFNTSMYALIGMAYNFKWLSPFQFSIQFSCMSSWVGHTPRPSNPGVHVIIVSLTHNTVCRPVNMYLPHHKPAGITSVMIWNKSAKDHVWKCRPIAKLANYLDRGPGDGLSPYITLLSVSICEWRPP